MSGEGRIAATFRRLKDEGRAGLVTFVTAGDPDAVQSERILSVLPAAGADVIELGMPFTDPMADGPAIQAASRRALAGGWRMVDTLALVERFRAANAATPIVLMGYYNPIHAYGRERFLADARSAGVDGLIVVDLPPEEDAELCVPARAAGLDFVRLATPTTDDRRLDAVLRNTAGFLYYVSVAGITGTRRPDPAVVEAALVRIRARTDIPVAVGFGVRTGEQAAALARFSDGVVVGSALVDEIAGALGPDGAVPPGVDVAERVAARVSEIAAGVRGARAPSGVA